MHHSTLSVMQTPPPPHPFPPLASCNLWTAPYNCGSSIYNVRGIKYSALLWTSKSILAKYTAGLQTGSNSLTGSTLISKNAWSVSAPPSTCTLTRTFVYSGKVSPSRSRGALTVNLLFSLMRNKLSGFSGTRGNGNMANH